MVVEERLLPGAAGPGDGEFAAGVGGAEEEVGGGETAVGAGIPEFEDGGDVLAGPVDIERAAVEQKQDDGFAGGDGGFEKLLLAAGKGERGAGGVLAAHVLRFAEDEDGNVRLLHEVDGVVELGIALLRGVQSGFGAGHLLIKDGRGAAVDLDAGGAEDLRGGAEGAAQAFEHGDGFGGMTAEAPGAEGVRLGVGERADDGEFGDALAEGEGARRCCAGGRRCALRQGARRCGTRARRASAGQLRRRCKGW